MDRATSDRRLLKLAAFLRTVPRRRFNYQVWVEPDWQGAPDLSCGTSACALGWATTIPTFRRLGLRLVGRGIPAVTRPGHLPVVSLDAAMMIFGLEVAEAYHLFYPSTAREGAATPKQVACKIEDFVKERAKLIERNVTVGP